jgi:NodT family efflux transporter outer membrane factor (OMF) lipoprotein
MARVTARVAVGLLAALLAACKMGPGFTPPKEPMPGHYAGAAAAVSSDGASPSASAAEPNSFWWQEFHDTELDDLERRAAAGNLDLKAAYMRIVEARMQVVAARAQGLPTLDAVASINREQLGLAGILKSKGISTGGTATAGTASAGTAQLLSSLEAPVNIYQLGFDASWELDLFGKVRRGVEGAEAQSAAAVEARNGLLVSLEAEVAQTYFQLRSGQMLRQIALDLIAAQRDVVDLTNSRHLHGLAGEADVASARGQLSNLESQLPAYDQTIATSQHALAVLTGQTPEALDAEFRTARALPPLPVVVPVGLPSSLARRRPDIRGAEDSLHAATAQVGVSVASLFPDVSLSGTFGMRNTSTRYLFDWASHFYTFGPKVSIPIFQGGALVANIRLSRAQEVEAALNYRKTVLSALQDVEDGLTALQADARRSAALEDTVASDQRAYDVDRDAYRHGIMSYLNLLTVNIQVVQARQQLAEVLLTQSTDLVKLYKALGGGWEGAPAAADSSEHGEGPASGTGAAGTTGTTDTTDTTGSTGTTGTTGTSGNLP